MRLNMRWDSGLLVAFIASALCVFLAGPVAAQATWADEIGNALAFYKASYPNSNWDPYQQKIMLVREAAGRGDQRIVRKEMGIFFKMLRTREHDISEVAADELYNFAVMVTPVQEYGISLPASQPGQ